MRLSMSENNYTDNGISLQRTELPQAVTVAGSMPVPYIGALIEPGDPLSSSNSGIVDASILVEAKNNGGKIRLEPGTKEYNDFLRDFQLSDESDILSVSVGGELQENPEPEPTPVSVSVGDEINTYGPTMKAVPPDSDTFTPVSYVGVGEPPTAADTTVTDTTTPDTSVDPGSLDGPNPIGGGHHQYHFVQYGETQEYLESLVKEGYMMVYHEDNPPEEGKLTISKPNPEPEPGTITITSVANPTEYIYGPYEPLQLTVEELIATLGPEKYEALINTTITATTTDTTDTEYYYGLDNWSVGENGELIYKDSTKYIKFTSTDLPFCLVSLDNRGRMMGDMDPPGQESTPPPVVTIEDLTPVLIPVSSELLQRFEEAKKLRQRLAERSNPIAFVSIMDAETAAVKSVQVACAEDDGWRTIGTLNNPDGIDWKYQAGNLTGSGTASVVWHAQELGALGVWTDGTDNWTAVDGWIMFSATAFMIFALSMFSVSRASSDAARLSCSSGSFFLSKRR